MSTKVESYKVLKTPNGKIVKINNGKVIKPFFDGFCLVAEEPNSTVELVGINGADAYMYYSLDSWKTYQRYIIPSTTGTNVITLRNVGDSVVFAAYKSMMSYSSSKYLKFVLSGNISARGKFSS